MVQCFQVLTLYFRYVVIKIHSTWADFQDYFKKQVILHLELVPNCIDLYCWVVSSNSIDIYIYIYTGRRKAAARVHKERNCNSLGKCPFLCCFFPKHPSLSNKDCRIVLSVSFLQEFSYRRGDYLLFGSETSGLPAEALEDCKNQPFGGGTLRIPMVETYVRCLNLSVSVGIAVYEASRQLNYEQLQFPAEGCNNDEQSVITEDVFAWLVDMKFCTIFILLKTVRGICFERNIFTLSLLYWLLRPSNHAHYILKV